MSNRFGSLPSGTHYDANTRAPEQEAREIQARRSMVRQTAAVHTGGRHVRIDPTVRPDAGASARVVNPR